MTASRRPEPPLEILERMRHPVPMEERVDEGARRHAAIDALASAIRRGGRSRRLLPGWLLPSAAAAFVGTTAVVFFVRLSSVPSSPARDVAGTPAAHGVLGGGAQIRILKGTAVTTRGDRATMTVTGGTARIAEGDGVNIPAESEGLLELPRGVRVKLAPSTEVSFVRLLDADQRLHLGLGKTEVSVPKPGGPAVFSIETPDSEVVVHGTEFSVLVERDETTSAFVTTVSVTRGSVFVAHGGQRRLLEPGAIWSSRAETSGASRAVTAHPELVSQGIVGRQSIPAAAPPSLAEQNRLFQSFLDARAAGDNVRALRLVDELLTRFPDTPLADQARIARFRVLQRLGVTGHEPSR